MKHVDRFMNKVLKRTSSPARTELAATSGGPSGSRGATSAAEQSEPHKKQPYGFFEFETRGLQPKPSTSTLESFPVDIIAVHGIGGDAYQTWTHPSTGKLWLRDFLPGFLPGCRVYTFGYPSQLNDVNMRAGVQEFSRKLLGSIRNHIEDSSEGPRPIIFVCHSLGGIVCKQALLYAHEDTDGYGQVLQSTLGIVFLATPHRGSDTANLANIFVTIAKTCQTTTTVGLRPMAARTDILEYLSRDSTALQSLITSDRHRLKLLSIVTFYESVNTPPLSSIIVDRSSAELGVYNEEVLRLREDHHTICRFESETSGSYQQVARAIRRIARQSPTLGETPRSASTHSSNRSEYQCN